MAKKEKKPTEMPVDASLLSDEDRAALTASAKESVDEAAKQRARDDFFDKETDRLRRRHAPAEQWVNIVIDSAPYVPFFLIDGHQFFCGYEYRVTRAQAAVLCEQMQRSWSHQDEVDGRSRFTSYRRPQDRVIGRADEGTVTQGTGGGSITADMSI